MTLIEGVMVEVVVPPAGIGRMPNLRIFPISKGGEGLDSGHHPLIGVVGALPPIESGGSEASRLISSPAREAFIREAYPSSSRPKWLEANGGPISRPNNLFIRVQLATWQPRPTQISLLTSDNTSESMIGVGELHGGSGFCDEYLHHFSGYGQ
ncbi:hypothetical protein CRG98_012428 [Punica granatum]|uniref:Uncharacterized protein n=1 Tax=Punica granatum TaxID=22663 RepID=A0A2I0KF99_PUNGR|nr:hypothetical protein CRG98_012428 [Punica granatum]